MSEYIGSRLAEFLQNDDPLAETEAAASKRVIAWQFEDLINKEGVD